MPNHCENVVSIAGPKEDITRLWDVIKTDTPEEARLVNLLPMPEELRETPSVIYGGTDDESLRLQAEQDDIHQRNIDKYGHKNWYDWAYVNWGTKWGDYDYISAQMNLIDTWETADISLSFHTAWGPFEPQFWLKVSADYPTLTFSIGYHEPGMMFLGSETYKNGEQTYSEHSEDYSVETGDIPDDSDEFDDWWSKFENLRDRIYEKAGI